MIAACLSVPWVDRHADVSHECLELCRPASALSLWSPAAAYMLGTCCVKYALQRQPLKERPAFCMLLQQC